MARPTARERAELLARKIKHAIEVERDVLLALDPNIKPEHLARALEDTAVAVAGRSAQEEAPLLLALGRLAATEAYSDEIAGVIYTSVLDKNRCHVCAVADDGQMRALDDPVRLARIPPNPGCQGRQRCRCEEFPVRRDKRKRNPARDEDKSAGQDAPPPGHPAQAVPGQTGAVLDGVDAISLQKARGEGPIVRIEGDKLMINAGSRTSPLWIAGRYPNAQVTGAAVNRAAIEAGTEPPPFPEEKYLLDWNPADHPRGPDGRFVEKGSGAFVLAVALLSEYPQHDGEPDFAYHARLCSNLPESLKHDVIFEIRERYAPVKLVADGARRWRREHGLPEPRENVAELPALLDETNRVARAFETAPDAGSDPRVQRAFADFKRQNDAMFDFITRPESEGGLGITVEFGSPTDEAYPSAEAQADDVRLNRHFKVQTGLGGEHGATMTAHEYDRFRAVHDIFGHVGIGRGFDRHGEYQAWLEHMTMYTGEGRWAMASEYHGVNTASWGGAAGTPGTGKSVLLPITDPWDAEGNYTFDDVDPRLLDAADDVDAAALVHFLGIEPGPHFEDVCLGHPHERHFLLDFDPDQPRDSRGRWVKAGGGEHAGIDAIETAADAVAWFAERGIEADFDAAPHFTPEFLRDNARAVADFRTRFPETKGRIASIKTVSGDGVGFEKWASQGGQFILMTDHNDPARIEIWLNDVNKYADLTAYAEADADDDFWSGISWANLTPYGRMTHELGHVLAAVHDITSSNNFAYSMNEAGIGPGWLGQHVSAYATSSASEAFAELFSTAHTPGAWERQPPAVRMRVRDFAAKLIEQMKTGKGYTSVLDMRLPA